MLVVLDHLFEWPSAGFIGVDVFFVISGFVITASLVREHDRSGRISFAGFYRRRIRRILPASTLVLIATCVAAYYAFLSSRFQETLIDAVWSLFFAANWRFAEIGTDYLQADGPISPLQHYWSLGIEEQFYVVWPAVMLIVLALAAKRGLHAHSTTIAAAVIGTVIAVSFGWAIYQTMERAAYAYFSTFTRVWELGAGALLALLAPYCAKIAADWRPVLGWLGLIGILVSAFAISSDSGFPAPWAALPVLSTVLVIAAGTGGEQRFMYPLTNPASQTVGNISYSLYLWHFPVIVILASLMPVNLTYYALCLTMMFLLSFACYYIVEAPINHSRWLEPKQDEPKRKREPVFTPHIQAGQNKILASAVIFIAVACVWAISWKPVPPPYTSNASTLSAAEADAAAPDAYATALSAELESAVNAQQWPANVTPSLDSLGSIRFDGADTAPCAGPKAKNCDLAGLDPQRLAVVVGNSIAVAYLPVFRQVLEEAGWQLRALTLAGCPFIDGETVSADESIDESCPAHKEEVIRLINQYKPALVIGSGQNGAQLKDKNVSFAASLGSIVSKIQPSIGNYVHFSPPPTGKNPQECASSFTPPSSCLADLPAGTDRSIQAQAQVLTGKGRTFVDTTSWYCTPEGKCPIFAGNTIVRRDKTHLTPDYATLIAPLVATALQPYIG